MGRTQEAGNWVETRATENERRQKDKRTVGSMQSGQRSTLSSECAETELNHQCRNYDAVSTTTHWSSSSADRPVQRYTNNKAA